MKLEQDLFWFVIKDLLLWWFKNLSWIQWREIEKKGEDSEHSLNVVALGQVFLYKWFRLILIACELCGVTHTHAIQWWNSRAKMEIKSMWPGSFFFFFFLSFSDILSGQEGI